MDFASKVSNDFWILVNTSRRETSRDDEDENDMEEKLVERETVTKRVTLTLQIQRLSRSETVFSISPFECDSKDSIFPTVCNSAWIRSYFTRFSLCAPRLRKRY